MPVSSEPAWFLPLTARKRDALRRGVITPMWISSVEMSSHTNSSPALDAVRLSTRVSGASREARPS